MCKSFWLVGFQLVASASITKTNTKTNKNHIEANNQGPPCLLDMRVPFGCLRQVQGGDEESTSQFQMTLTSRFMEMHTACPFFIRFLRELRLAISFNLFIIDLRTLASPTLPQVPGFLVQSPGVTFKQSRGLILVRCSDPRIIWKPFISLPAGFPFDIAYRAPMPLLEVPFSHSFPASILIAMIPQYFSIVVQLFYLCSALVGIQRFYLKFSFSKDS